MKIEFLLRLLFWTQDIGKEEQKPVMYSRVSNSIMVMAQPIYLEEESLPLQNKFFWAYQITIKNKSESSVVLRRRHWFITDSKGAIQEVEGRGVVGKEPILKPGESFTYTSGALLTTPSGIMVGNYEMEADSGEKFEVSIPAFSLDSPYADHTVH
jgi:ApaG protein